MNNERILGSLNIFKECKEYNLSLWQCPRFLFLVMGVIIILSIIATHFVARRFVSPEIVAFIVLVVTAILFVISYIIISAFEQVAKSSRAKSIFISIMSHRLRSPLSSIRWYLDILSNKPYVSEEDFKNCLLEIKKQNEKMIKIINDLIDLNNIEDNNFVFVPSKFSLKDLTEEIVQNYPEINIVAANNLPPVFADREYIKKAIQHLVDNAIRYSLNGGKITITIEKDRGYVKWSINDEGIGIPKDEQKKIFTKFFRGEGSKYYQTEGTGIGLFITKNIIEKSKGKIGFNSIEGRGSTFWFTLPIAQK